MVQRRKKQSPEAISDAKPGRMGCWKGKGSFFGEPDPDENQFTDLFLPYLRSSPKQNHTQSEAQSPQEKSSKNELVRHQYLNQANEQREP